MIHSSQINDIIVNLFVVKLLLTYNIFEGEIMAYAKQSNSLKFVQKFGPDLENAVKQSLGWSKGRLIYFNNPNLKLQYDVETDCCWPNLIEPQTFVSVTYCRPDKPGHSNENKLQLKLGELLLLKARYPKIRAILVVGGNRETWLPYVLRAFNFFFDRTVFAWQEDFQTAIEEIKANPTSIILKHREVWQQLSQEWNKVTLYSGKPINTSLRKSLWLFMKKIGCQGELPSSISNEIFRHCMISAFDKHKSTRGRNGKEWYSYAHNNWDQLWESRSFFNPGEAAIELSLKKEGYAYLGGLAKDVDVPSLIHHLGGSDVDRTKVSEDYILYSNRYNKPVFIQSKSTGGGFEGHGKNIQNRTKEQLARSLFYRGLIDNKGNIKIRPKDYIWIGVLDGNWGVTQVTPLKYIHMLQWAGYDYLIAADSLTDKNLNLQSAKNNPLIKIISELECVKNKDTFDKRWTSWCSKRFKKFS
jgi:hypothetical protein